MKTPLERIIDAGFYGVAIGQSWNVPEQQFNSKIFTVTLLYKDGHQDIEGTVKVLSFDINKLMEAAAIKAEEIQKSKQQLPNLKAELLSMINKLTPEQRKQIEKGLAL